MMTYEERQTRGTELCRRLAEDVALLSPPGIGTWDEAWAIVTPASAAFMDALATWEATASGADHARVRVAYDDVVDAWRTAVARWLGLRAPGAEVGR